MAGNDVRIRSTFDDRASSKIDRLKDKVQVLGKTAAGQGVIMGVSAKAAGVAFGVVDRALAGVTDRIFDSIQAASDLSETVNKSAVIFGDYAGSVESFGDTAAKSFGQSKEQAISAAATFGNLFNTIGLGQKTAADMSVKLVQLGSDLASFNNIDPAEALAKLQSGLVGEAKPLRELGILLNESQTSAKALELGFKPVNGQFTEGQKVLARYNLILEQSTAAQGDFARTTTGMANQQRILSAELENTSAKIGEKLIPVALEFQKVILRALDATGIAIEDVRDAAEHGSQSAGARLNALQAQVDKNYDGMLSLDTASERAGVRIAEVGDAAGSAIGPLDDLESQTRDTRTEFDKTRDAAEKLAAVVGDFEEALFGPTIKLGDLAQAQQDLSDLMKKEPPDKHTPEYKIWAGDVATVQSHIFDLEYEIAKLSGDEALYNWASKAGGAFGDLDGHVSSLLLHLKAEALKGLTTAPINFVPNYTDRITSGGTTRPGGLQARALGGPVSMNTPYIVGERGPELFVPRSNGSIVPNGAGGGGGQIHYHYEVTVQGNLIAKDKEDLVRALSRVASVQTAITGDRVIAPSAA